MEVKELKEKLEKIVNEMHQQRTQAQDLLNNANKLEGQAILLEDMINELEDKEENNNGNK